MYVQINAGRNINGTPMSDADWITFQQKLVFAVQTATAAVSVLDVEIHTGFGQWESIVEESVHVSVVNASQVDEAQLHILVANAAKLFEQDAIAVVIGSSTLVPAVE